MSNPTRTKLFPIIVKGIAASLSAYLLGLAIGGGPLSELQLIAASLSTFSLVMLLCYIAYDHFDEIGEITNTTFIGVIYSLGVTGGFVSFAAILATTSELLAVIFFFTWVVGMAAGIPFLKKPNK